MPITYFLILRFLQFCGKIHLMSDFILDKFREECGVFGIFGHAESSTLTQLGLFALQHRGQEACGIVSSDGENLHQFRSMGLVADVLSEDVLKKLKGASAIGHTRYSTAGKTRSAKSSRFPSPVNTGKSPSVTTEICRTRRKNERNSKNWARFFLRLRIRKQFFIQSPDQTRQTRSKRSKKFYAKPKALFRCFS